MNAWLKRLAGMAVVVQAGFAWAGDGPWTLRLGVSYRDFDEVSFGRVDFPNWGAQETEGGPYGVQNATTAPGLAIGDFVILDYVRHDGGSEGVDSSDKLAPIIGFRYDLTPECKQGLAVVGNFQYYQLDFGGGGASGSAAAPGGFTVEQYKHHIGDALGTLIPGDTFVGGPVPGTTFSVRNTFDMDLYVFDLGLEGRATVDRFNFTLALGPSLTIADAESSQGMQASWDHQGLPLLPDSGIPAGTYTSPEADESDTDFLLGAYAAVGVTVDLSTSWSVGVEYRYDYVCDDAGTSQAELDLSGSSGILRLGYRF